METLLHLSSALGLGAACGFRIFVPIFALSLASILGYYLPPPDFAWLSSSFVAVALGLMMAFEMASYYIPFIDDFFDIVATPAAIGAGIMLTFAELDALNAALRWLFALVVGGGFAGAIQLGTVSLRRMPLASTQRKTNFIVSTIELAGAALLSLLAFSSPILSLFAAMLCVGAAIWVLRRKKALPKSVP